MIIQVPENVKSDFAGFSFFVEVLQKTSKLRGRDILFKFTQTKWFEANLCAVLGAVVNIIQANKNNVQISVVGQLRDLFMRNQFAAHFGGATLADINSTTIKYRKYKLTDEKLIKEYLDSELLGHEDFPRLSFLLRKEITRSIFEIFSNAILHGNCEYVYSCGQYYPNKVPPRIDLTIVDIGQTIKTNVNNFLRTTYTGTESILWAVTENNTTKPVTGNIPGGLGFKLIQDFIKINKGKIQIVSSDGYWQFAEGIILTEKFDHEFPGTIINIEFKLDDSSIYHFSDEDISEIKF